MKLREFEIMRVLAEERRHIEKHREFEKRVRRLGGNLILDTDFEMVLFCPTCSKEQQCKVIQKRLCNYKKYFITFICSVCNNKFERRRFQDDFYD